MQSLIPFGLHQDSGRLVDVASVARGGGCGCICPSCGVALVARQGEVNEWHFAHRSRHVASRSLRTCEYSLYMSVRLMFRQLAIEGLRLRTPAFVDTAEIATEGIHRSTRFDFVIARESVLELEAQQVGSPFSGVEVDVLGHVKNVPFVIYCTYPGRAIPTVIRRPEIKRCGVLELNLTATAPVFLEEKSGRYTDVLRTCIEHSTTGRSWVYHPRYDAAKEEAEKRALARLAEQEPSEKAAAKRGYQCLACGHQWRGTTDKCSHCNTHLYAART